MRSIICLLFTFQLRKLAVETTEIVCVILGENANILQNMQKAGNFNLEDNNRSKAPRKFDDGELKELLNKNPIQKELAKRLGLSDNVVHHY